MASSRYITDARVWIPHPEHVWQGAVLTRDHTPDDKSVYIRLDTPGSGEIAVPIKSSSELPLLRNPTNLIGQHDLTYLSYLNEPEVLYNLQLRFCERHTIYTYCGIILVAINPYAELPLYGSALINAYRGQSMGQLEPHIFAIAEEAYTKLERESCNVSIIVSGESGAGKTMSAKYAMRYFAAVGGSESETSIERKVLASSPIMEAIGNAKTTRNDNSSRFGKYTKLVFITDRSNVILKGATMQTFLLEKSRVVFQSTDERNYHIFYQLCAARDKYPELILEHPDKFWFLNQGQSPNISRVSDLAQFQDTLNALSTLDFAEKDVKAILTVLSGILHLGNVGFRPKMQNGGGSDGTEADIDQDDLHLGVLCDLWQLDTNELRTWLTTRQIESGSEVLSIPMSCATAMTARDALAKHIYAKLFQYIVDVINKSFARGTKDNHLYIGVLDIYGFEAFETNSFEQFCINYANEKLQQQFNQHVFKLEQEVYLREGIEWSMVDFHDNQPCIDMLEDRLGIFSLLDEECRMPRGTDESWIGKVIDKCKSYEHFSKPKFGQEAFVVKHFSGPVQYEAHGFVEKNQDTVSKELINVIVESKMELCNKLMLLDEHNNLTQQSDGTATGAKVVISAAKPQPTRTLQQKKTVGSEFRQDLQQLISSLNATSPHYIRCIKPNDNKVAFQWEASKIVSQLRACGVLETVRISAAGFPSRWSYEDFIDRYGLLVPIATLQEEDPLTTAREIITKWIVDTDKYRFGKTLIFLRAGQVAFLEEIRASLRKKYVIAVQSNVRRFIYRKRYLKIRAAILGIQRYGRGLLVRRKWQEIREEKAAIVIQRHVRGWLQRIEYKRTKDLTIRLQARCRGYLTRQKFRLNLDNLKATTIQRYCRGYLARKRFNSRLQKIIICQAAVRRFLARKRYKKLRAEARTVAGMQKKYLGLENKIISMQQQLDEYRRNARMLKKELSEVPQLRTKLEAFKKVEAENASLAMTVESNLKRIEHLESQLVSERDEKMMLVEQRDREQGEWDSGKNALEDHLAELQNQIQVLEDTALKAAEERRVNVLQPVSEIDDVQQRAVSDKEVLAAENAKLREEVLRLQMQLSNTSASMNYSSSLNTNSSSVLDEDRGYGSGKNTLNAKSDENVGSPTNSHNIGMILRLRKLLEEEKENSQRLQAKLNRYESLKRPYSFSLNPEDRIRLSELEVEHEKTSKAYESLRQGIARGTENQVMHEHYVALQEELKRRKEESVQLKTVLAAQSQSMRSLNENGANLDRFQDYTELLEAYQALKLVNRQLEAELSALTEEHNVALGEFSRQEDESRAEVRELEEILNKGLQDDDTSGERGRHVIEEYMRHEVEKTMSDYVNVTEEVSALRRMNQILVERLREHGLNDSILLDESVAQSMAMVNKKPQTYQGIFKYQHEDEGKIIKRLLVDFKPAEAVKLPTNLPAYIFLMCIRYTDLMNADQHVKTLLSNIVTKSNEMFQQPVSLENRILTFSNIIRLYNLLCQYGGLDDFANYNTDTQNRQQLKNFDLTEYRMIILSKIIYFYRVILGQAQASIKRYIVPAILEYDETTRGKKTSRQSLDNEQNFDPTAFVCALQRLYDIFQQLGLNHMYVVQAFNQIFYYISAVALNNLLLRPDLCTWRTGMKIKYNTGVLSTWATKQNLSSVISHLEVLVRVSALLQTRKSDPITDVKSIVDMCDSLSSMQIQKIIRMYRSDDAEPPISQQFMESLDKALQENEQDEKDSTGTFMLDEQLRFNFKVPYLHSEIRLENVELPASLNLKGVLTKI